MHAIAEVKTMANIKQQNKRNKTNEKARKLNSSYKSSLKTAIKNVLAAVKGSDKSLANTALNEVYKKLDKAQAKGLVHKNYVARHKSELATKVAAM